MIYCRDHQVDTSNDVVNPLYAVNEKEDTYDDEDDMPLPPDNAYEKLDEYQAKMLQ